MPVHLTCISLGCRRMWEDCRCTKKNPRMRGENVHTAQTVVPQKIGFFFSLSHQCYNETTLNSTNYSRTCCITLSHFLYICMFSKLKAMIIMCYSVFPSLLVVTYFEDLYMPGLGWALGMRRTGWFLSSQSVACRGGLNK